MQPATKKLSVTAILFGIVAGIIGIAGGLLLGFALGAGLAAAFHVSSFEGEAGYFAAAIALIVTCIVAPGPDCSYALLAQHKRSLALYRVDHSLRIARSDCSIRSRNLVRRPTPYSEHQWADAAARV